MKLLFLRLLTLIALSFSMTTMTACGSARDANDVSGSTQVQLPWIQKDGSYALQIVELTGLANLYELGGQFARFFMSPSIANGHLSGSAPKARFLNAGGIFVPTDEVSLQLATVYAHMQRLAQLDTLVGAGSVNHWPRDIGVAVRLSGGVRNNAFYDGETDSMLFVPYVGKDLPISVNAGILAHEHFHSLFYKLVMLPIKNSGKTLGRASVTAHSQEEVYKLFHFPKNESALEKLPDNKEQVSYHILLMRGLNEGIADFWGWFYTGNPDFIADSLPSEKRIRTLTVDGSEGGLYLNSSASLQDNVRVLTTTDEKNLTKNLNSYAYNIGTQYSRILKALTDKYAMNRQLDSAEARREIAGMILRTLPNFKDDILKQKESDFYQPSQFLISLMEQLSDTREDECELIAGVVNGNDLESQQEFICKQPSVGVNIWQLTKQVIK